MNPSQILKQQEALDPEAKARTGLSTLELELLSLERGEEPNLDRVLRALDVLSDALMGEDRKDVPLLCSQFREFVLGLREDEMELSLEDLDVLLVTCDRIREFITIEFAKARLLGEAGATGSQADLSRIEYAPDFRDSGLCLEVQKDRVLLGFPALEDALSTGKATADLRMLWKQFSAETPWTLDLREIERIPVALIATLIQLQNQSGPVKRPLRLEVVPQDLQSEMLIELLELAELTPVLVATE